MAGTALVLEGGGYRGIYTGGVTDVLLENGITDFSSVWGVSAGAMSGANFVARQIGRTVRVMLAFRDDSRLMSMASLVRSGNITNVDFMYDTIQNELDPFDTETFNANLAEQPFVAVATDVLFGRAGYLRVNEFPRDIVKVQASASLPALSEMVEIDGHYYLDGGTGDSVPFERAMGIGGEPPAGIEAAERCVVVLTRDRTYKRPLDGEALSLRSGRYIEYPFFTEALRNRGARYNAMRERLWEMEREGRCLVIAPETPVEVGVSETKGEPLIKLYHQGRAQTKRRLEEIKAFV